MKVFKTIEQWLAFRGSLDSKKSLGFVPTLGGLHEGHFALMRRSLQENEITVASIFLNRVQFNNPSDCAKYPAIFADDVAALEAMGVDAVFAPDFDDMYPDDYRYRVTENCLSTEMEGAHRPGHFDGVLTVVLKLFNIVAPQKAYFGEKDYQQLELVKGMVRSLFLPIDVVSCPTVRAADGLALSSRNRRLSSEGRERAAEFPRVLRTAVTVKDAEIALSQAGFEVEYVEETAGRRLAAVVIEGIRLIDNMDLLEIANNEERELEAMND